MAIVWKWGLNWNANALVWPNGTDTSMSYVDWKSNLAGSFNGTSSRISIWTPTTYNFWTNSFYVYCFIKSESWWTSYQYPLIRDNSWAFPRKFYAIEIFNWTLLQPYLFDNWNWWALQVSTTIWYDKWYDIVFQRNRISWLLELYLDWKLVNSVTDNWFRNMDISAWLLNIGWISTAYYKWNMDEVEIWSWILSPAEVKNKHLFYNWFI